MKEEIFRTQGEKRFGRIEGATPPLGDPLDRALRRHFGRRLERAGSCRGVLAVAVLTGLLAVAGARAQEGPIRLSLREAVLRALEESGDLRVPAARSAVVEVKAQQDAARSRLLPRVSAAVGLQRQTRSLEAFGLRDFGLFQPPRLVGPFTVFDSRLQLTQPLFDAAAWRQYQAADRRTEAARESERSVRDTVAAEAAVLYLDALQARASLEAAQADVALAEELLRLAEDQKAAGTGTAIDVTRARVRLSAARQAELAARTAVRDADARLKQRLGLPAGTMLELTEVVDAQAPPRHPAGELAAAALERRADVAAQRARVAAARRAYEAARSARWPSVVAAADYGSVGSRFAEGIPTWSAAVTLRLPFFEGGELEARKAEAKERWRQEELRLQQLEREVRLQVELASSALELAQGRHALALETLRQAEEELEQARRRYRAGVTTNLEVTDAQAAVAAARSDVVESLHDVRAARIRLSLAAGTVLEDLGIRGATNP
ncbi:MAG: TolC family outer membrane protein [Acidobacteriota bacterium]